MISKTVLSLVILLTKALLASDRLLQLSSLGGDSTYNNPYANPVLPLCFLGNNPVCSTTNETYANECIMILMGKTKQYEGWCNTPDISNDVDPTTAQTPDNGYLRPGQTSSDPNCGRCNNIYMPVCGLNGVTYQNFCKLKECAEVEKASDGPCGVLNYTPSEIAQDCPCMSNFQPVCGVDGLTYANGCTMLCAGIAKKSDNACIRPCGCTNIYKPVCTTTMKTFDNECLMRCENETKMYDGKCPSSNPEQCQHCAGYTQPVCGKNGITYDNPCYMNCTKVEKYADGPCPNTKPCECADNYLPVCGIDHKTYRNECLMNCNNIKLGYFGVCKDVDVDNSIINGNCNCGTDIKYICGQDQRTYLNTCYLNCLGKGKGLHWGKCQFLNPNYCRCPVDNKPVCGTDNKSYQNECAMNCMGAKKGYNGECWVIGNSDNAQTNANESAGAPFNMNEISKDPAKLKHYYNLLFPKGVPVSQDVVQYQQYFLQLMAFYKISAS